MIDREFIVSNVVLAMRQGRRMEYADGRAWSFARVSMLWAVAHKCDLRREMVFISKMESLIMRRRSK